MATFSASGIPDPTPNVLFSAAGVNDAVQKTQANALAIQDAQLKNNYAAATLPAQANLLLQGIAGLSGGASVPNALSSPTSDAGQTAPASFSNASADPNSRIPAPQDGQMSLFHGQMPISADPGTQALVGDVAQQSGVNPEWAMRVHYAESGASKTPFGPGSTSSAGALGPMQLMPGTAQGLGVDPTQLRPNIAGGVKYLAQLKQQYGSPVLATAAYNVGPDRVDAFLSGKAPLPHETVNYVGKVFGTDGPSLLNDALSGFHGPTPGHTDGVGTTSFGQPGAGLQAVPQDETAKGAVRQLIATKQYLLGLPGGAGVRAVGQIQQQLDNIAGPGGIVGPDGSVYRVPGSYQTRFAASQATEAGKSGPAAALYAQNDAVRQAGDQQTHAVNAGVDLQKTLQTPTKLSPGETLTTPETVGVGPISAGVPAATSPVTVPSITGAASASPVPASQARPFVIGDSIGQGTAQANGLPGVYKSGSNQQAVLGMITGLPANGLQGRSVIISTGASNDAGDTSGVQQQIDAAKAKGAASITLIGVGPHDSYVKAGTNDKLATLAQQNGIGFTGPLTGPFDSAGVHPANYRGLGLNVPTPAQQQPVASAPNVGAAGAPSAPASPVAAPSAPATRPGIYQAPVDPSVSDAAEGAKQAVADQADVMKSAKDSASSLNRIGQIRQALANTTAAGLPPGALAEPISKGIAIAKYLGADPAKFGIDPSAVPNEQVAREGLTQLTGLLLKQIFPGRITDTDLKTYGSNFASIAQDPAALDAILNQAQHVAQYDVDRAHDMLGYKAAHNNSTRGWDTQWYQNRGFGPDLFDAAQAGTAPAGPRAAPNTASSASRPAAPAYTLRAPARPQSRADVMALPPGTPFFNPADGRTLVKH